MAFVIVYQSTFVPGFGGSVYILRSGEVFFARCACRSYSGEKFLCFGNVTGVVLF